MAREQSNSAEKAIRPINYPSKMRRNHTPLRQRPKYTADASFYLARNCAKRRARCSELCDAIMIERFSRTPEPFAFRPGVTQASANSLLDQRPLELRHRPEYLEH